MKLADLVRIQTRAEPQRPQVLGQIVLDGFYRLLYPETLPRTLIPIKAIISLLTVMKILFLAKGLKIFPE